MRDGLKFRVWDKNKKTFMALEQHGEERGGYFISRDGDLYFLHNDDYYLEVSCLQEADDIDTNYVIQRCSGLNDRNGKLIYEADIVSFVKHSCKYFGTVCFVNYCLGMMTRMVHQPYKNSGSLLDVETGEVFDTILDKRELKIVGNIFENPELLER